MIELTPLATFTTDAHKTEAWNYVFNSAKAAGLEIVTNDALEKVSWCGFQMLVDGKLCGFDMSDFVQVPAEAWKYKHWFRFHYTEASFPNEFLHSFPQTSFTDWELFDKLRSTPKNIDESISAQFFIPPPTTRMALDLHTRRTKARDMLVAAFRDKVITERRPQEDYFRQSLNSLVSVHIPGSWRHSLDRAQIQMFALGVPTISPDIWTCVGDTRPQPWDHYVPIRDDYSDLVKQTEWCLTNRDECLAIGTRAQQFFDDHASPKAIWDYVAGKVK